MSQNIVRYSKFLSKVLRHKPQSIGLALDANGWANVDELLACAQRAGVHLTRELLERVVAENDKQRFAFDDAHTKIRANQGHSIQVDLQLEPQTPPDILYHGTAQKFLPSIRAEGLKPLNRNQVHLSADAVTATKVGARHGEPVVLMVKAREMFQQSFLFYLSANGVWLTDRVPQEFIEFPIEQE
jgi:putative RNA 2'-phosphotransferase